MKKLLTAVFLFVLTVSADAGPTVYQYKDAVATNFGILLWGACGGTQFCTGMVIEDTSGNEKGTSANPFTIDTGVTGNLINAVKSPPGLGTSGGWTPVVKAGIVGTVLSIKASAGQLGMVQCDNVNAAWSYLQIFNVAAGSVILGTTVPVQVLMVPPSLSNGFTLSLVGMQYSTAISVAATTTATGLTAVSSGLNCTFGFN